MKTTLLALALLALTGCATVHKLDRSTMTQFDMVTADTWAMRVTTGINYPPESEKAEGIRLKWIGEHTQANGCSGFEVTSRQWTKAAASLSDRAGTLTYSGTCTR